MLGFCVIRMRDFARRWEGMIEDERMDLQEMIDLEKDGREEDGDM